MNEQRQTEREQRENAERQLAREQRAAFIASVGYDAGAMERLNATATATGETEATGKEITQVIFPRIDVIAHTNRVSLHCDKTVIIAPPVARVHADTREGTGRVEPTLTNAERKERIAHEKAHPFLDGAKVKRADDIANDIILKRNEKTGKMMRKSNGAKVSKKPRGQATCEALFCHGEREDDSFSRTIALRYLTKRLIFSPRSSATGKEDAPATLKARKTSSSKHQTAFFVASDIEDIIQEAFILWATGTREDGAKKYATGNKLFDTCNAVRDARNAFQRRKWAEAKRLDILKMRMQAREDKERGYANRFYDAELDALTEAMREHGASNQRELADALGISAGELCKRLGRLRERAERMERAEQR